MMTCNTDRRNGFRCLLALVTVTTLAVPYIALAAGQSFGRSGSGMHGQPSSPHHFHGFGILVVMDSTISGLSLFSSRSLHQPPSLALL
jgi:hypothetical protein